MTNLLRKMSTKVGSGGAVSYELVLRDQVIDLNAQVGLPLSLSFTGRIFCIHCGRKTSKSFSQGYCYPCFSTLPETDMCIVKPEKCHFHLGSCRNESWGVEHCMIPHTVYLANSSGLKVGITRSHHKLNRWVDQGASQAIVLGETKNRLDSGLVEVTIAKLVPDKTNWRKMLQGSPLSLDLVQHKKDLLSQLPLELPLEIRGDEIFDFSYPVIKYPEKLTSLDFEKTPTVNGILNGIKGQYLLLDTGVLNVRKFAGFEVSWECS